MALGATPNVSKFDYDLAAATRDMESRVGKLQARREYRQWSQDWSAHVADDRANGRVSVISVKPPSKAPGGWEAVASGSVDERIRSQASRLASFGSRAYLTFHHEPENDAPGQSAVFRAAETHFYDVVKSVAPSLPVGPTLMTWTTESASGRSTSDWLPPADKMDFVGWDGYNFNRPSGAGWVTPAEIFDKAIALTADLGKPALISETGINGRYEGPHGELATDWLRDVISYARARHVRVMTYYNTGYVDSHTGKMTDGVVMTDQMEDVFRRALQE
jgi:hypothetical protein